MFTTFEYDVFLSFASNDEEIAKPIWQEMCLNGLRVFWSDTTLKDKLGESWFEVIQSSLENSRHFVLLCTPSSMSSKWVKREYVAFLNHCYKASTRRLIPVLVGDYKVSNLPLFLRELEACELNENHSTRKLIQILGGTDIEELKAELTNKTEENSLLKQELSAADFKIESLQHEISDLSQENSSLKIENTSLQRQLGIATSKIGDLQHSVFHVEDENSLLKKELVDSTSLSKPSSKNIKTKSTAQEAGSIKLYVGNLSNRVKEDHLRQLFETFGEVTSVILVRDKFTGEPRGFGFVEMPVKAEAIVAIEALNGRELDGRALIINKDRT